MIDPSRRPHLLLVAALAGVLVAATLASGWVG